MTVHELLAELEGVPGTLEIVLATDSEGNSFSPLSGAFPCVYRPTSEWDGDISEVKSVKKANAICLWPVT